jgi:hypothetical protein
MEMLGLKNPRSNGLLDRRGHLKSKTPSTARVFLFELLSSELMILFRY